VLVRGLGPAAFEPDGYVVVPGTVDVPALSYFAARVNIRLSYAESLSYEVITYANLLARLADSPPLQGKIYLATNRLASAPNLAVVFWGDSPATPGHYVSQQAYAAGHRWHRQVRPVHRYLHPARQAGPRLARCVCAPGLRRGHRYVQPERRWRDQ
jgi:hypothetical protein